MNPIEHFRALQREYRELRAFAKDVYENGLRADLNPTLRSFDRDYLAKFYPDYLATVDRHLRHRAARVLGKLCERHVASGMLAGRCQLTKGHNGPCSLHER